MADLLRVVMRQPGSAELMFLGCGSTGGKLALPGLCAFTEVVGLVVFHAVSVSRMSVPVYDWLLLSPVVVDIGVRYRNL